MPCSTGDENAWATVKSVCEARGLLLCTASQYKEAYADKANYGITGSSKYGYTSTTTGCESNAHILMSGQTGEELGCHPHKGCYSDRYFRCCQAPMAALPSGD